VGRRGSSSRAAALRAAQQAKAERDAERALREQQVEAALTDFYEATARVVRIRDEARRKADGLVAAAEQACGDPVAQAREAVCRLRELTGSTTEVARLCGLGVAAVREMLAAAEPDASAPRGGRRGEEASW